MYREAEENGFLSNADFEISSGIEITFISFSLILAGPTEHKQHIGQKSITDSVSNLIQHVIRRMYVSTQQQLTWQQSVTDSVWLFWYRVYCVVCL